MHILKIKIFRNVILCKILIRILISNTQLAHATVTVSSNTTISTDPNDTINLTADSTLTYNATTLTGAGSSPQHAITQSVGPGSYGSVYIESANFIYGDIGSSSNMIKYMKIDHNTAKTQFNNNIFVENIDINTTYNLSNYGVVLNGNVTANNVKFLVDGWFSPNKNGQVFTTNFTTISDGIGNINLYGSTNTVNGNIGAPTARLGSIISVNQPNTNTINGDIYALSLRVAGGNVYLVNGTSGGGDVKFTRVNGYVSLNNYNILDNLLNSVGTNNSGTLVLAANSINSIGGSIGASGSSINNVTFSNASSLSVGGNIYTGSIIPAAMGNGTLSFTGSSSVNMDNDMTGGNSLANITHNGTGLVSFNKNILVNSINIDNTGTLQFQQAVDMTKSPSASKLISFNANGILALNTLGGSFNATGGGIRAASGNGTLGTVQLYQGSFTGDIGASGAAINILQVSDSGNTTINGNVYAHQVSNGAYNSSFNNDINAMVNFTADGMVTLSNGKNINGLVTTSGPKNGNLTYLGATNIDYSIGSITNPLNTVNFESGNTTLNANLFTNATTLGSSSTCTISSGGSLNTDILTLNGATLINAGGTVTTNALTMDDGTIVDNANTIISTPVTLIGNNGNFNSSSNNNLTLSAAIIGSGALNKTGAGELTLAGANTYTGTTNINQGTLKLNSSSITSNVTVASNSVLSGSGAIVGNISNSGTVILGSSSTAGTINLTGNYNPSTSGALQIYIEPTTNPQAGVDYSTLQVSGNANLNNSTLVLNSPQGGYSENTTFTFLNADTINGNFNNVAVQGTLYTLQPVIENTMTTSTLKFVRLKLESNITTTNKAQSSLISYLDQIPNHELSPELGNIMAGLLQMPSDTVATTINSLSPARYTTNTNVINQTTFIPNALISGRLDGLRLDESGSSESSSNNFTTMESGDKKLALSLLSDREDIDNSLSSTLSGTVANSKKASLLRNDKVWISPFGMVARQSHNLDNTSYKAYTKGIIAGFDHKFNNDLILGISGGFSKTNLKSEENGGMKNKLSSLFTSLYGSKQWNNYYIDACTTYAYNGYKNNRHIITLSLDTKTKHHGYNFNYHLGTGYNFTVEDYTLTPHAGLSYSHTHENGYTETGAGVWDMTVQAKNSNLIRTELGFKLAHDVELEEGILTTKGNLSYINKRSRGANNMVASLSSYDSSFIINGTNTNSNECSPSLELILKKNNGINLGVTYNGEFSKSYKAHQSLFYFSYKF